MHTHPQTNDSPPQQPPRKGHRRRSRGQTAGKNTAAAGVSPIIMTSLAITNPAPKPPRKACHCQKGFRRRLALSCIAVLAGALKFGGALLDFLAG